MTRTRKVRIVLNGVLLLLGLLLVALPIRAQGTGSVSLLEVKGAITPVVQGYIGRGIDRAVDTGARLIVIQLDTPGGSVEIMKELTDRMVRSPVPIAVWVGPAGARAASAGTFVTLAAHVAAMAPGTTIGAASVVDMQGGEADATSLAKVTNDLAARIRNYTQRRGPEAMQWAESAVREAVAATAEEVHALGVIDFVAADVPDLLRQMDGFTATVAGQEVTLQTANAPVERLPMSLPEQLLHVITDPNIAFILLTLGLNGLLFELASPGGGAAGIIGGICLVLALYALGVLSVNWTGILFIILAFVLFVVDVKAATHGLLTLAGIASFIFGALILFNTPIYSVSLALVVSIALATGGFFAFAVGKVVQARLRPATTGREALVGKQGVVRLALDPEGMVMVHGELWKARSEEGLIEVGATVEVLRKEGFVLVVRKV